MRLPLGLLLSISICLIWTACGSGGAAASGNTNPGAGIVPVAVQAGDPCSSQYPNLLGGTGNGASGNCNVTAGGMSRSYRVHVPLNFQSGSSGLVIILHGSRGTGTGMETTSHFTDKSDQAGFAVVYPNALADPGGATTWNGFYNASFGSSPPDDSGFLRQVISTLQGKIQFNAKRVYVVGFSSGGFMAHRAGVELSDVVAGIGVVEGALSSIQVGDTRTVPPPLGPVAVVVLHGSSDTTVPYCGAASSTFTITSQELTFNYWKSHDACSTLSTSAPLCDSSGNITSVTAKRASSCNAGTEVAIYELIGGSHTYYLSPMNNPSVTPYNPNLDSTTGATTNDILWNFFNAHPKP